MPNVKKKNLIIIKLSLLESETIFSRKIISERKKINYCYGSMPSNFQVICGSVVRENCRSLASTKTSGLKVTKFIKLVSAIFYQIFVFSPNDSPSKTVKNSFYFI